MRVAWIVAGLLALGVAVLPAAGQPAPGEAGILGNGMGEVKKQADLIRMNVGMQVEGKDMKDALAKLKAREEAIKPALVKLGAEEASIDFGEASVLDSAADPRGADMARMVRSRLAATTGPATQPASKPVTVVVMVNADWSLKAGTADEALLAGSQLGDKIKAAKLFGAAATEAPMTEAEEEQEGMGVQRASGAPQPGEPSFMYVAKITEEDRAKAVAAAFKKAAADAARLAKAAGVEVGTLRQLMSSSAMGDNGNMSGNMYYSPYGMSPYQTFYTSYMRRRLMNDSTESETLSPTPGDLSYRVAVVASFGIK